MRVLLLVAAVGVCLGDRYHPEREPRSGRPRVASVSAAESTPEYWVSDAQESIARRLRRLQNRNTARNVVMFLGDGMSVPTLAAARTLLGQRQGHTGEEAQLAFEEFPTVGMTKTYCVNAQIPDSACTAMSYLCGVKVNRGTLGVSAAVQRWDCPASTDVTTYVDSIAHWALADDRDVGIVTTTRVTHASPAGAYAKVANRGWENDAEVQASGYDPDMCPDIAYQLINSYPANHFKVILGGGRQEFLPNTTAEGLRLDGRDLIQQWLNQKEALGVSHAYVTDKRTLLAAADTAPEYLLGLFEASHLPYNMEANHEVTPTLAELTEVAIKLLQRNEKGFFLFVEGGRIDHAHHDNFVELALDETIEFSAAVARAQELLDDEDSLIVVTSDHAHVMAFNGYTERGGDILGPSDDVGEDNIPYMTLSYTNGPGHRVHQNNIRPDVTAEQDYRTLRWQSHVDVPLDSETHGGDDVAVFATGPQHHLFSGLYEQSHIPHLMAYAACIGPGRHACDDQRDNSAHSIQHSLVSIIMLSLFILFRQL